MRFRSTVRLGRAQGHEALRHLMNQSKEMLTTCLLALAVCLLWPVRAAAQTIVRSFDGDSGPGLAACQSGVTHCDRPEMDVAVNGKQVAQVTWQSVRIYDYNGRLLASAPMTEFVRRAGLNPIPPPAENQLTCLPLRLTIAATLK